MMGYNSHAEALDKLLSARRQHTLWVSEIMNHSAPLVAEDHTQCDFGKWILGSGSLLLGEKQSFQQLIVTHKAIHHAYKALKDDPAQQDHMRRQIRLYSHQLFDLIDKLEQELQLDQ